MSMLNTSGGAGEIGETVATVADYDAAQKLVSQLIAGEVPARQIAIVGVGVRTVERVTGRLGYANAARSGAVNGVLIGLFLSAIFVLGNPAVPMQAFIGLIFVGVAIGMILSLIAYSVVRRRRDYASVMQLSADHYEVTVLPASVGKARQVLGRSVTPIPQPRPSGAEPPQYGERVDPNAPTPPQRPQQPAGGPSAAVPFPASPDLFPAEEPPRYGERIAPPRPPLPPAPPAAPAAPAADESVPPAEQQPASDAEQQDAAGAHDVTDDAGSAAERTNPEADSDAPRRAAEDGSAR
ncbi:general stress protein [Microbacterium sp. 22242]|uniref:general stress protein n=1 Tax=Microbacterium sp. 22242 TaxID=3453896 RepID=UPI003F860602